MKKLSEQWVDFKAIAKDEIPVKLDKTNYHKNPTHGDIAVKLMVCISTIQTREFHVNAPNNGAITNLPTGAIKEKRLPDRGDHIKWKLSGRAAGTMLMHEIPQRDIQFFMMHEVGSKKTE